MTTLVIVTRAVSAGELAALDDRVECIALIGDAVAAANRSFVDRWLERSSAGFVVARGALCCQASAVALAADLLAMHDDATLQIGGCDAAGHESGAAIAAAFRRSSGTLMRALAERDVTAAADAVERGWADALVPAADDSVKWLRQWLGGRSLAALYAAATLTRRSHSEAGERSEFARLFSTGEPHRGLAAFLRKEPLDFSSGNIVEIV